jgi:hypothetical protein
MKTLRGFLPRCALVLVLALACVGGALAFFAGGPGTGTASATVGSLATPTIASATPGAGTVALSWSTVTPPVGPGVAYYVTRAGGTVGGNCPSSPATATSTTSCTDSGLTKGTYTYTVTAVWQSWTATSAGAQATLGSGALSRFQVTAPSGATAGTAFTATITAQDAQGNTVAGYAGAQAIAFSGPANAPSGTPPSYPAPVTFTNGVGNASITLYDAQTTTLTATQGSLTGTSANITVTAGANHQISASATSPQTAGSAFTVTLTAQDTWGNPTGNLAGVKNVTFSGPSTSPSNNSPVFPATVTFTAGTATASVTLVDAQTTTITANDTTDALAGVATGNIVVNAGAASAFSIPTPGTQTAGAGFNVTLTALDAYGNTVTGYSGAKTIAFTGPAKSPSGASPTYPASVTFTNGAGTASVTLVDAQSTTLTATQGTITGTTGTFTVTAGAASSFSVATPTTQTAGTAFNVTVTALDASGNTATGYTGAHTITFTGPAKSPSGASPTYPASLGFANGAGTASITLVDAQSTTLTATEGTITGTTGTFTVNPAAVSALAFMSAAVSGATSSTATLGPVTVQEQDTYGNPTTTAETVSLSSTSAQGVFSISQSGANVTSVSIPAGQSSTSFYYGDTTAGTPTITAAKAGLTAATQQETITASVAGLGIALAAGSSGTLTCQAVSANYTCHIDGLGANGSATFTVSFLTSTGAPAVYSLTQPSTINAAGTVGGSVTIAAGASSSSPNTLTAVSGSPANLSFGPYTLHIRPGP